MQWRGKQFLTIYFVKECISSSSSKVNLITCHGVFQLPGILRYVGYSAYTKYLLLIKAHCCISANWNGITTLMQNECFISSHLIFQHVSILRHKQQWSAWVTHGQPAHWFQSCFLCVKGLAQHNLSHWFLPMSWENLILSINNHIIHKKLKHDEERGRELQITLSRN